MQRVSHFKEQGLKAVTRFLVFTD